MCWGKKCITSEPDFSLNELGLLGDCVCRWCDELVTCPGCVSASEPLAAGIEQE